MSTLLMQIGNANSKYRSRPGRLAVVLIDVRIGNSNDILIGVKVEQIVQCVFVFTMHK